MEAPTSAGNDKVKVGGESARGLDDLCLVVWDDLDALEFDAELEAAQRKVVRVGVLRLRDGRQTALRPSRTTPRTFPLSISSPIMSAAAVWTGLAGMLGTGERGNVIVGGGGDGEGIAEEWWRQRLSESRADRRNMSGVRVTASNRQHLY